MFLVLCVCVGVVGDGVDVVFDIVGDVCSCCLLVFFVGVCVYWYYLLQMLLVILLMVSRVGVVGVFVGVGQRCF